MTDRQDYRLYDIGFSDALDQAAERIKALPIYGLKFLYRDDVLAVLDGMRVSDTDNRYGGDDG